MVAKEECHSADLTFSWRACSILRCASRATRNRCPLRRRCNSRRDRFVPPCPRAVKVLVVHADTNWAEKRWPVTRFIDLLDRFLSRHRDFVAWVVGMGHEELNVGSERDRVFPQLGLPLDLTMGLVANADLFVGIDSSMLHAADLARVPGVGLFGPTRAATWGFRFAPHRHVDRSTMADITVAEVLGAMEEILSESMSDRLIAAMRHAPRVGGLSSGWRLVGLSEMTVLQGGQSLNIERGTLSHLLQARNPAVYFSTFIGDSVLTLPTLRALAEMFAAPLTLMCPKIAFDLCFREVSPRLRRHHRSSSA